MLIPTAAIKRQVASYKVEENKVETIRLPRDTVYKKLNFVLSGAVKTSYASGSPVADDTATMERIINSIMLRIDGREVVKQMRPHMMRMTDYLATGVLPPRYSKAGATKAVVPTTPGKFVFGSSGQYTAIREQAAFNFQNVLTGDGQQSTWLDTRGASTVELEVSFGSLKKIQKDTDTADVTYSESNLRLDVFVDGLQNLPLDTKLSTFKQTFQEVVLPAGSNQVGYDLNKGNAIQGVLFIVRDGTAGSEKALSDELLDGIQLVINGTTVIQSSTFRELQYANMAMLGIERKESGGKSPLDGVCYMDLLTSTSSSKFGDINSAQLVKQPEVDELRVKLSNPTAKPATVQILLNEVLNFVG